LSQLIEFWQFDLKYRGRRNILNNRNNFILYLLKPTESSSKEKRLEGSMNMSGGKSAPFGTSDNRLSSIALATYGVSSVASAMEHLLSVALAKDDDLSEVPTGWTSRPIKPFCYFPLSTTISPINPFFYLDEDSDCEKFDCT